MTLKYIKPFLWLLLVPLFAGGQVPVFKQYTTKDGLSGNTIYYLQADHKGFMWMAGDQGLSRFNGLVFKNYTREDGLSDHEIFKIVEDGQHKLWFLTNNGLPTVFDNDQFMAFEGDLVEAGKVNVNISHTIVFFGKDSILIGSGSGLFFGSLKKGEIWRDSLYTNSGRVHYIWPINKQAYGLITDNGILLFEKGKPLQVLESFENHITFSKACHLPDGIVFFSKEHQLFSFHPDHGIKLLNPGSHNDIIFIKNIDDEIWLGKRKGVFRYEWKNEKLIEKESFLLGYAITSIEKDRENGYWFSTLQNGVFYTPDLEVRHYPNIGECHKCNLSSLKIDNHNNLWMASMDGYIFKKETNKFTGFEVKHRLTENKRKEVFDIYFEEKDIWLQTNGPILKWDNQIKKLYKPSATRIMFGDQANGYYFGGNKGLWYTSQTTFFNDFEIKSGNQFTDVRPFLISTNRTTSFVHDHENNLWVGSDQGLATVKRNDVKPFHSSFLPERFHATNLFSVDEKLLVATSGNGLYIKSLSQFQHLTVDHGLPSNFCSAVWADSTFLLVGSIGGFSIFEWISGHLVFKNFIQLDMAQVNRFCEYEDQIYVATSEGLTRFPKRILSKKQDTLLLYPNAYRVNENPLENITLLPTEQNNLQFTFETVCFNNPQKIVYEYRLAGEKMIHKVSPNNTISFVSLPPGSYDLEVTATIKNSLVSSKTIHIPFKIKIPFWQSSLFRILLAVLLAGLTYAFFKFNILTYNREVAKKLIQRLYHHFKKEQFILVKDIKDGSNTKLVIPKIKWIESNRNYCTFYLKDKTIISRVSLKDVEQLLENLEENHHVRIHRSFIINTQIIEAWHSGFVKIGTNKIPVGPRYKDQLKRIK